MATSYPLWSDAPAAEDLLGFAEIAVPIVEAIGRDRLDPVAIGVFGPWGSGKSTLLEIVSRTLESDYITIRVQPWAYDPAIDAKAALIGDVLAAVRERVRTDGGLAEEVKTEIKDRLTKLVKRVRWSKAIS